MTQRRRTGGWREGCAFGLHYDLHAVATDTELGAALTPEHLDAELRRIGPDWVQCDAKGHPGYTSYPTKVGSASPGIVRDALRIHRDVTAALGMPLAVHYSGLYDERALELRPEWRVVHADGSTDPMKVCPRSSYRDELMVPQLLELIREYDVDGFWVDGENWGSAPCWCDRCRDAFGEGAPTGPEDAGWQRWLAFHRECVIAHVAAYCDAVHDAKPGCAVVSSWLASSFQPEDLVPDLDWLSGDTAPTVSPLLNARVLDGRGLPWELMTWTFVTPFPGHPIVDTKPQAHLRQEAAVTMSCGGAVAVYDLPQRSGHLVGFRQEAIADLAAWCRARRDVVLGTTSVPQVAVLQSERHHYLHTPPLFAGGDGDHPVRGAVHTLLEAHCSVDVINEAELRRRGQEYPLVVVPEQEDLSGEAIEALERYVDAGGRLLLTGTRIADVLPGLVGAKAAGPVIDDVGVLRSGARSVHVIGPWQPVEVLDARPVANLLASREPDDVTGHVVVTVRDAGRGRVVAVHGPLFLHQAEHHVPGCRDLVRDLCVLAGPDLAVELGAPARVHVTLRARGDDTIVHLVNMGGWHPLAAVTTHIEEVPPSGPLTVRVRTAAPPADVRAVPAGEVAWSTAEGWTTIRLGEVGIHTALVLEAGATG